MGIAAPVRLRTLAVEHDLTLGANATRYRVVHDFTPGINRTRARPAPARPSRLFPSRVEAPGPFRSVRNVFPSQRGHASETSRSAALLPLLSQ